MGEASRVKRISPFDGAQGFEPAERPNRKALGRASIWMRGCEERALEYGR